MAIMVQVDTEAVGLGVSTWRMESLRYVTQSKGIIRLRESPVGCGRRPAFPEILLGQCQSNDSTRKPHCRVFFVLL